MQRKAHGAQRPRHIKQIGEGASTAQRSDVPAQPFIQRFPHVRRLLCEFAHAASRTTSVFKSKFQSLVVRRGYKRAIIAIGHKILRTIFFMLKRREHYRDCATDYEALSVQRNAPRWIKALIKFGFIAPVSA